MNLVLCCSETSHGFAIMFDLDLMKVVLSVALQAAKGKANKKAARADSDSDIMSMSDDSADSDFEAAPKKVFT